MVSQRQFIYLADVASTFWTNGTNFVFCNRYLQKIFTSDLTHLSDCLTRKFCNRLDIFFLTRTFSSEIMFKASLTGYKEHIGNLLLLDLLQNYGNIINELETTVILFKYNSIK